MKKLLLLVAAMLMAFSGCAFVRQFSRDVNATLRGHWPEPLFRCKHIKGKLACCDANRKRCKKQGAL